MHLISTWILIHSILLIITDVFKWPKLSLKFSSPIVALCLLPFYLVIS